MTTIRGDNGKKIEFAFSNVIHECERDMYIIEMPTVICNNRKDAELIQEEVGAFISELSKTILKDK